MNKFKDLILIQLWFGLFVLLRDNYITYNTMINLNNIYNQIRNQTLIPIIESSFYY